MKLQEQIIGKLDKTANWCKDETRWQMVWTVKQQNMKPFRMYKYTAEKWLTASEMQWTLNWHRRPQQGNSDTGLPTL